MRSRALTLLATLLCAPSAWASIALNATLNGAQEVPAVSTSGTGTAAITITGSTISYTLAANNLSSAIVAAHIHAGAPGVAGDVIVGLNAQTLAGTVENVSAAAIATILSGDSYVNIHTADNPGGEIRGQLALQTVAGVTCSCSEATTPGVFRKCVRLAIKALDKEEKKSAGIKALKQAVKQSSCGKTKGPKKAVGCCLAQTPEDNIVIDHLCAPISEKACGKKVGAVKTDSCFDATPCSSSGAFID